MNETKKVDYFLAFVLGLIYIFVGLLGGVYPLLGMGGVFSVIGFAKKSEWIKMSDLSSEEKKKRIVVIIGAIIILLAVVMAPSILKIIFR